MYGPAGWAFGKGGVIQSVSQTFTPSQLMALNTAPVTVLKAPGAGKMILGLQAIWSLKFNSNAYGNDDNAGLWYGAFGGTSLFTNNQGIETICEQTSSAISIDPKTSALGNLLWALNSTSDYLIPVDDVVNQPIVLADDQAWTTGDSNISLTLFYTIVIIP